jgi:hypothetical protein
VGSERIEAFLAGSFRIAGAGDGFRGRIGMSDSFNQIDGENLLPVHSAIDSPRWISSIRACCRSLGQSRPSQGLDDPFFIRLVFVWKYPFKMFKGKQWICLQDPFACIERFLLLHPERL